VDLETSNFAQGLIVASASPQMIKHPWKGRGRGHVNHLNFGGQQPYLCNGCSYSR